MYSFGQPEGGEALTGVNSSVWRLSEATAEEIKRIRGEADLRRRGTKVSVSESVEMTLVM